MQGTEEQPTYTARTATGFVYFIACDGHVKIGHAKDVDKRLRYLQCGNPHQLDLIGVVEGGRGLEAEYHKRFRKLRVGGEWFRFAPPLTDEILRLANLEMRTEMGWPADVDLARIYAERMGLVAPISSTDEKLSREVNNGLG